MGDDEKPLIDVEAFAQMADAFRAILELVDGHRAECIRRGYSETASEVMAMDLHRALFSGVGA